MFGYQCLLTRLCCQMSAPLPIINIHAFILHTKFILTSKSPLYCYTLSSGWNKLLSGERELGLNNYTLLEKERERERERRPLPHLKHRTLIYTELDAISTKDINIEVTQGNLKKRTGI
ncbi:hypothetical protein SRHO_G00193620 [Serrasalmus rhombeus]